MFQFLSEEVSDRITRIYGISGEQMYLIKGTEKAALIDTGCGIGDLKDYISRLTGLPVVVLATHGHLDHAMGAVQFPEVWMSRLDASIYTAHSSLDLRKEYLESSGRLRGLEDRDFLPAKPLNEYHDLKDGQVFRLGGISIEAVACGGHTPGSMMFLIPEEKILISGDACCFFTMLQDTSCLTVSEYESNLKTTDRRTAGKYSAVLMSHGHGMKVPVTLMKNVLEVCKEIEEGKDDRVPFTFLNLNGFVAKAYSKNYMRTDGGFGNIVYNPDRI